MSWKQGKKRSPFKAWRATDEAQAALRQAAETSAEKAPQDMTPEELDVAVYETRLKLWQEEEKELRRRQLGTYGGSGQMVSARSTPLSAVFRNKRRPWK